MPIGQWVLETACRQLVQWRATGWSHLRMAVNLSAVQFRQTNLVEQVRHLLDAEQLPADALELEVTESILMSDAERTALILNEFGAMGVTLAIDDFGTGYSSLGLSQAFFCRRARSTAFVHYIGSNKGDAAICSAIIGLAHNPASDGRRRRRGNAGTVRLAGGQRLTSFRVLYRPPGAGRPLSARTELSFISLRGW